MNVGCSRGNNLEFYLKGSVATNGQSANVILTCLSLAAEDIIMPAEFILNERYRLKIL